MDTEKVKKMQQSHKQNEKQYIATDKSTSDRSVGLTRKRQKVEDVDDVLKWVATSFYANQ